MKIAIIGSRSISEIDLKQHISKCTEIVSGGAKGVDLCASEYARQNNIKLTEFLPEYSRYGKAAPIIRNKKIVDYADEVIAFWDGKSKGTLSVIRYAEKSAKPCKIVILQ